MALVDTIRSAVATAANVVDSVLAPVQHAVWLSADGYGKAKYGRRVGGILLEAFDPLSADVLIQRKAIVELQQKIREVNGRIVTTYAHLTFLTPFVTDPDGDSTQRQGPVDSRDVFVLPDGRSAPVVDMKGMVDAGTNAPFFMEVWLGALSERGTLL
jgi:hypothetical protein